MIDIDRVKEEIVESLLPLEPEKIILFGSFAYGTPNNSSDIDIFLVKSLNDNELRNFEIDARMRLINLTYKYQVGIDVLSASEQFLQQREDYFYKVDILKNGKVLYAK